MSEGGFGTGSAPSLGHTYHVQEGQHSQPLGLVFGFFKAGVVGRVVVDNVQLRERDGVIQQEVMNGCWVLEGQTEGTVTTPICAVCASFQAKGTLGLTALC